MKINQVEELVGITKKNIRFYEEQGLLNPDRNPENGYREYSLDDVKCLLKIKLLRKIDVPIEEIRKLERGNVSFEECMQTQRDRLESEKSNVELMIGLCSKLESEVKDYDLIDAQVYLDELHKLEKGGAVFMDLTKNDVKNRSTAGAIVAALCSIALIVLIVIPSIFIILIVTVLLQRIKEIRKGEAYEARKY